MKHTYLSSRMNMRAHIRSRYLVRAGSDVDDNYTKYFSRPIYRWSQISTKAESLNQIPSIFPNIHEIALVDPTPEI